MQRVPVCLLCHALVCLAATSDHAQLPGASALPKDQCVADECMAPASEGRHAMLQTGQQHSMAGKSDGQEAWMRDARYPDGLHCLPRFGPCDGSNPLGECTSAEWITVPDRVNVWKQYIKKLGTDLTVAQCQERVDADPDCGDFFHIKSGSHCECVRVRHTCCATAGWAGEYKIYTKLPSPVCQATKAECPARYPYAYRPTFNFDWCCSTAGDKNGNPNANSNSDLNSRSDGCEGDNNTPCSSPPCVDYQARSGGGPSPASESSEAGGP